MSTFRVTLKVVGDGVDPVAIGFVRVPLDASLAVNTLYSPGSRHPTPHTGLYEGRQSCMAIPEPIS